MDFSFPKFKVFSHWSHNLCASELMVTQAFQKKCLQKGRGMVDKFMKRLEKFHMVSLSLMLYYEFFGHKQGIFYMGRGLNSFILEIFSSS